MGSRIRSTLDPEDNFLRPTRTRDRTRDNRIRSRGLKRSPLAKRSKGLKSNLARYKKVAGEFLCRPENHWCICCTIRREVLGERILRRYAVEVHHWAGRIGRLLCYVPYFKAFCRECREWPHNNARLARKLGLLAPASKWEVFPEAEVP